MIGGHCDSFFESHLNNFFQVLRLRIAGAGPAAQKIRHLVATLDLHRNVEFLGWVKPENAYPLFDVLVVPSRWNEPFGRIVVEALAYSVPVICARSGGIAESILSNENGFTFESGNHVELATLLRDVIEANAPGHLALSQNALQHSKSFDIKAISKRIDDFLTLTVAEFNAR